MAETFRARLQAEIDAGKPIDYPDSLRVPIFEAGEWMDEVDAFLASHGSDYARRRLKSAGQRRSDSARPGAGSLERISTHYREVLSILEMVDDDGPTDT